jgi:hypothetical protein
MLSFPIFISSSDAYSDLWFIFFDLFKKYWPEYDGVIYLNTENKKFHYDGLNIKCTQVGNLGSFGKTFRVGLDKINSPYVMLIMIDYFFMGKVNDKLIREYFEYFKNNNLDSLCLLKNPYTKCASIEYKDLSFVIPPSENMYSTQIAFWKKNILYEMALPHENPWLSEWYGTLRANYMKIKLAYTTKEIVIPYLPEGALHKGKWVDTIVQFLKDKNYDIDYSKRGFFIEEPLTIESRIKSRIRTCIPRILSNLDLLKRRYLKK